MLKTAIDKTLHYDFSATKAFFKNPHNFFIRTHVPFSIVWSPSLGEEGSGTMRIPNSFCCAKILIANQILGSENVI